MWYKYYLYSEYKHDILLVHPILTYMLINTFKSHTELINRHTHTHIHAKVVYRILSNLENVSVAYSGKSNGEITNSTLPILTQQQAKFGTHKN